MFFSLHVAAQETPPSLTRHQDATGQASNEGHFLDVVDRDLFASVVVEFGGSDVSVATCSWDVCDSDPTRRESVMPHQAMGDCTPLRR